MKTIKKRRNQNKTDYLKRLKLLKGETPRLVFRKTNRYIVAQYTKSQAAQDQIVIGITSRNLLEYGWPKEFEGSLKSITASYLTGFLIGKKIIDKKMEAPILDIGMTRSIAKSKIYSFAKGVIDSGVKMNCDKKMFPEEDRIKGKSLKKDFTKNFETIKSNILKK
jgi:large subunit ribosomal protein L18